MSRIKRIFSVIKESVIQMQESDLRIIAGALAFTTVLSFIPFIAITLSTFKAMGGLEFLYPKVEAFIIKNLAGAVGSDAIIYAKKAVRRIQSGNFGLIGGLFLVLTSVRLLADMEIGINRVWKIRESRHLGKRLFFYWALIVTLPFMLAGYVAALSSAILEPLKQFGVLNLVSYLFLTFMIFLVYKIVPATKVHWKPAMVSSAIVAICLLITKAIFTWLVKEVFTFGKLYGGIASIIVFLFWILTIWHVLLIGVAVCASLQKRRIIEST